MALAFDPIGEPASPTRLVDSSPPDGSRPLPDRGSRVVLVLDSDSHTASMLSAKNRGRGVEVVACHLSEDAVEVALELRPSLIVLGSEDASVFGVCDALRRKRELASTPVVLLAPVTMRQAVQAHRASGDAAEVYLRRPLGSHHLDHAIFTLLQDDEPPAAVAKMHDSAGYRTGARSMPGGRGRASAQKLASVTGPLADSETPTDPAGLEKIVDNLRLANASLRQRIKRYQDVIAALETQQKAREARRDEERRDLASGLHAREQDLREAADKLREFAHRDQSTKERIEGLADEARRSVEAGAEDVRRWGALEDELETAIQTLEAFPSVRHLAPKFREMALAGRRVAQRTQLNLASWNAQVTEALFKLEKGD